jgi:hypothetical protein
MSKICPLKLREVSCPAIFGWEQRVVTQPASPELSWIVFEHIRSWCLWKGPSCTKVWLILCLVLLIGTSGLWPRRDSLSLPSRWTSATGQILWQDTIDTESVRLACMISAVFHFPRGMQASIASDAKGLCKTICFLISLSNKSKPDSLMMLLVGESDKTLAHCACRSFFVEDLLHGSRSCHCFPILTYCM